MPMGMRTEAQLVGRLLEVIEQDIVPLTRVGVARGDKVFGAAILRKSDRSLVVAATNRETENPLFHGEISTLNAFYDLPRAERPPTSDCLFLTTHEPCSLCLSAITWAGFDNFYYLFGYAQTRDAFVIPHDLRILEEVFALKDGAYVRRNAFWQAQDIPALVSTLEPAASEGLVRRIDRLTRVYAELSGVYQAAKGETDIPLA